MPEQPSLDNLDTGVLGWLRRGLQLNPMTGAAARVSERAFSGEGDRITKSPIRDQAQRPTETKVADVSGGWSLTPPSQQQWSLTPQKAAKPAQPWENDAGQMVYPPGT